MNTYHEFMVVHKFPLHHSNIITASDLQKCQSEVREQKQYRDELEAKLMAGEDLVQQQVW